MSLLSDWSFHINSNRNTIFRSSIGAFATDKLAMASSWHGRTLFIFCVVTGTALDGKTGSVPNQTGVSCVQFVSDCVESSHLVLCKCSASSTKKGERVN